MPRTKRRADPVEKHRRAEAREARDAARAQLASARTAIKRPGKASVPGQWLFDHELIAGRALDFGCGKSQDAAAFCMDRYDPVWAPHRPRETYDTILCTYVLNVLHPSDQHAVLEEIRELLTQNGAAYISVRRDVKKDGFTSRGTYQRNVELELPLVHEECGRFAIYRLTR